MRKKTPPGIVRAIRQAPCGISTAAREFGLSVSTVFNIRHRKIHADVPDEWPVDNVGGERQLTDEQVREIRASVKSLRQLAREHGISVRAVQLLKSRREIYLDVE